MDNPKILHQYAFFAKLSPTQLKSIAKIAREISYDIGTMIFKEGENADGLYILVNGSIDLFFTVDVDSPSGDRKELHFGIINPGELFGISALIEPYTLTSSARVTKPSLVIRIDGISLQNLCMKDDKLAYAIIQQVARTSMERLSAARLQLATALSTV